MERLAIYLPTDYEFAQLHFILSFVNGESVPLVRALMPNRLGQSRIQYCLRLSEIY